MANDGMDRRRFLKGALLAGASAGAIGATARAAHADEKDVMKGGKKKAADDKKKKKTKKKKVDKVPRKKLGNTGEEIPILVMGCAQRFNAKYDKMLHKAYKEGVDYLDTALVYARGESHKTIAPFLKQIKGGRKKIWITSKAPHRGNRATTWTFERDLTSCLWQLETDYLDLFFMHALDNTKYLNKEYIKMGERLKKQKKIRFFGFSCHSGNVVELMNKAAKVGGIDAIMFRYNFTRYGDKALNKAIDACKKAKIGLIAMKTQSSVPGKQEKVVKFRSKNFTLGQAKLKAVWADERIDSCVSHIINMKLLKENVAAAKSPIKISMNEFHQLNRLGAYVSNYSCQGCSNICEPAVEGETRVADALRFLMYHECYDEPEKARELYRALKPAERNLDGIDFARAAELCPQGIDIAGRLQRAKQLLA